MAIGRTIHIETASPQNPRNSEGDFIALKDGTIMLAYSRFTGESSDDNANADIYAVFSHDDGETWGEGRVIYQKEPTDKNLMSVTLRRMSDESIGLFYLRKYANCDCKLNLIRSYDEGLTWSDPVCCIPTPGYYVVNNDRVVQLSNGKIIVPAAHHKYDYVNFDGRGTMCFFVSEDDGFTWRKTAGEFVIPFKNTEGGLQEPGILELNDGRLWCWARCSYGFQFEAFSDDDGETWSDVNPNPFFTSPCAPMSVKRIQNNKVLATFNPIMKYNGREYIKQTAARTPLVCAVSDDGASGFGDIKYIEDDPTHGYCYEAIFAHKDYILISYIWLGDTYGFEGMEGKLDGLKIKKIHISELE